MRSQWQRDRGDILSGGGEGGQEVRSRSDSKGGMDNVQPGGGEGRQEIRSQWRLKGSRMTYFLKMEKDAKRSGNCKECRDDVLPEG